MKTIKKNGIALFGMAVLLVMVMRVSAAGSVSVNLNATQKSAQSAYAVFDASRMYCEVTSASKYPIKFQEYGKNSSTESPTIEKSVTYNVNASGTVVVSSSRNMHSIKLTGWNVSSSVKNCIGWGKVY